MFKFNKKAALGVVVVLAMLLGAWSSPFQTGQSGQSGSGSGPGSSSSSSAPDKVDANSMMINKGQIQLSGDLAKVKDVQSRINDVYAFSADVSGVNSSNVTEFDKSFVEDSITSNTLELWTMNYALTRVKSTDVRNLIKMMIAQHVKDQADTIKLAQQLGIDTNVDFTNASVYPETPQYDLGERTENLKQKYLDFLVAKPNVSFDDVALQILDSEHTDDVQAEMAAERLVSNPVIKAMTKHSADVTGLHLELLDMVSKVQSLHFSQAPGPDFQQQYQVPFMITVMGQSSTAKDQAGLPSQSGSNQSGSQSGQSTTTP